MYSFASVNIQERINYIVCSYTLKRNAKNFWFKVLKYKVLKVLLFDFTRVESPRFARFLFLAERKTRRIRVLHRLEKGEMLVENDRVFVLGKVSRFCQDLKISRFAR